MKQGTDVTRLAGLIVMLGAVGALAISSIPLASAMMSPDYDRDPLVPFEGQEVTFTFTGDVNAGAPHSGIVIRVLQPPGGLPDNNPSETQAAAQFPVDGQCDTLLHNGDQIAWELRRDADNSGTYTMAERVSFVLQDGDIITVKFGKGDPDFTLTDPGGDASTVTPNAGTFAWVEVADNTMINTDNTNTIGNGGYRHGTCGTEVGGPFQTIQTFTVSERIAGTVLPLDTTALLIAGATANALWMLPMIGAIATGIGIYTFKRK